jgi:outer membrane murein-binding lipoprotein Lpp
MLLVAAQALTQRGMDSSPVSKVIKLLEDMKGQLEADKASDEEMYDKLACWCKKNDGGKNAAVEIARQKLSALDGEIEELTAKASELDTAIKTQDEEVASNTQALATATKMREEEMAKFQGEEKDMILSIDSLKNALVVLEKSQASFLQQDSVMSVRKSVRDVVSKTRAETLLEQILTPDEHDALTAFMQAPAHTPQSGEIMGILKQMRKEFASNLADMQGDESKAVSQYAELKSAKDAEIAAGEKMTKEKTALLSKTKVALASAKEDHEDTTGALTADEAFLVDLKERCSVTDTEWAARSKTRALEIQAVSETIKILTDDDAHDTFHQTLSFLQVASMRRTVSKHTLEKEAASHIIMKLSQKSGRKELVQLAASVQLDSFTKVKDDIQGMIDDLDKESEDEVKHKAFCNEQFHKNDMKIVDNNNLLNDITTKVNDLTSAIASLGDDIAALRKEIEDTKIEMQRANELRISQNKEFQETLSDQRATQSILKKALDRLAKFYSQNSLVQLSTKASKAKQEPGAAAPPPPPSLPEYKTNGNSGSVMTMIEGVIKDAAEMEAESIKTENDAEASYHSFLAESYASIKAAGRSITNKVEQKAQSESAKVEAEADKADAETTAATLEDEKSELHKSCDFIMENFDAREAARKGEVEGLQTALAKISSS